MDAATAAVKHRPGFLMSRTVSPTLFSPDGRWWLTVCSRDTNSSILPSGSWLWDLSAAKLQPRPFLRSLGPEVMAAAYHPNGQTLLLGCQDGSARFWDVGGDKQTGPTLAHASAVTAVAWSRDGRRILTGSRDGVVRLWDAATGDAMYQPVSHRAEVTAVAFSPDGNTLLTGSLDGTARFWDPLSGRPLGPPLRHGGGVRSAAYHPGGAMVTTGSKDHTAQRWHRPIEPMAAPRRFAKSRADRAELHEHGTARPKVAVGGRASLSCGPTITPRTVVQILAISQRHPIKLAFRKPLFQLRDRHELAASDSSGWNRNARRE